MYFLLYFTPPSYIRSGTLKLQTHSLLQAAKDYLPKLLRCVA